MADALDSKSSDRKVVGVQVPPPVLLVLFLDVSGAIGDPQGAWRPPILHDPWGRNDRLDRIF
jgi:hypothetical protein